MITKLKIMDKIVDGFKTENQLFLPYTNFEVMVASTGN
jgi:hypothetical protein